MPRRTMGRTRCLAALVVLEVTAPLTSRAGCFVGLLCLEVCLVVNGVSTRILAVTVGVKFGGCTGPRLSLKWCKLPLFVKLVNTMERFDHLSNLSTR